MAVNLGEIKNRKETRLPDVFRRGIEFNHAFISISTSQFKTMWCFADPSHLRRTEKYVYTTGLKLKT